MCVDELSYMCVDGTTGCFGIFCPPPLKPNSACLILSQYVFQRQYQRQMIEGLVKLLASLIRLHLYLCLQLFSVMSFLILKKELGSACSFLLFHLFPLFVSFFRSLIAFSFSATAPPAP